MRPAAMPLVVGRSGLRYRPPAIPAAKLPNPALYPHVAAAVEEGLAKKRENCRIEARRVLQELSHAAFFDPLDLVTAAGQFRAVRKPHESARAVRDVKEEQRRNAGTADRRAGERTGDDRR